MKSLSRATKGKSEAQKKKMRLVRQSWGLNKQERVNSRNHGFVCDQKGENRTLKKMRTQSKVTPVFKKEESSETPAWKNNKDKDFLALHIPYLFRCSFFLYIII